MTLSKMILIMFVQLYLYVKCGHFAVLEGRAILPLQNISDEKEMEKVSQRRDSCSQGDFHTKPEFFVATEYKRSIFNPPFGNILETVYGITTIATCLAVDLIFDPVLERLSGERFCECDCYYAHAASHYKYCEYPDITCLCIYTEEDRKKLSIRDDNLGGLIPESKELPIYSSRKNSTTIVNRLPQGTEVQTQSQIGNKDSLCKPLFEDGLIKLACALIDDGGNPFYTVGGSRIFPVDICSIDCHFIHGARKGSGPYGQCCDDDDGVPRCICLY